MLRSNPLKVCSLRHALNPLSRPQNHPVPTRSATHERSAKLVLVTSYSETTRKMYIAIGARTVLARTHRPSANSPQSKL